MAERKNCWEILKCGFSPNGDKGYNPDSICTVVIANAVNGINNGKNGGRICWAISGTRCYGEIQKSFEEKENLCLNCKVFKRVLREEGLTKIKLSLYK